MPTTGEPRGDECGCQVGTHSCPLVMRSHWTDLKPPCGSRSTVCSSTTFPRRTGPNPGFFLVSQKRDVKNLHQGETFPLEKKNVAPRQERKRNKCIFHFPFREIHPACHPALRRVTTPSLLIRVPLREITRVITLTSGWENLKIGSRVQFPFALHMEKRSWMRKHTRKSEKGARL